MNVWTRLPDMYARADMLDMPHPLPDAAILFASENRNRTRAIVARQHEALSRVQFEVCRLTPCRGNFIQKFEATAVRIASIGGHRTTMCSLEFVGLDHRVDKAAVRCACQPRGIQHFSLYAVCTHRGPVKFCAQDSRSVAVNMW